MSRASSRTAGLSVHRRRSPPSTLLIDGWFVGLYQYLQGVPGSPFANTDFSTTGLELNNAVVQSDDLDGGTFASGTEFSSGSVAGSTFVGDSLIDADFGNGNASHFDFTNADLDRASFSGANTGNIT